MKPLFGLSPRLVVWILAGLTLLLLRGRASAQRPVASAEPLGEEVIADGTAANQLQPPAATPDAGKIALGEQATATPTPAPTPTPMPSVQPAVHVYGWVDLGFAANFDSPRDRINFGANLDWRSNDYRLNQVYLVCEKPLEHEKKSNIGYRVDFLVGHDAPFFVANGLFSSFTGFDATSGVGVDGPASFRRVNRIGIDMPQFYVEVHIPDVLGGIDIRAGKFYTLMGREVYPAADTDFYSRTYENIYGTPFTHTGILTTIHAAPTLDIVAGVVRGWDVFEDNNGSPSFHGSFIWNSPDKRYNWTTAWITGPEQPNNNRDYRTLVSSYLTAKLGNDSRWLLSTGGHYGVEAKAAIDPATGRRRDADWYAYSAHLFYTVHPRLRLGMRAEWFRDDEGTRTGQLKRPGFAASFYDLTLGLGYTPYPSVQIRPEVRWDWTPEARPFNDQADKSQLTAAVDVIWRF